MCCGMCVWNNSPYQQVAVVCIGQSKRDTVRPRSKDMKHNSIFLLSLETHVQKHIMQGVNWRPHWIGSPKTHGNYIFIIEYNCTVEREPPKWLQLMSHVPLLSLVVSLSNCVLRHFGLRPLITPLENDNEMRGSRPTRICKLAWRHVAYFQWLKVESGFCEELKAACGHFRLPYLFTLLPFSLRGSELSRCLNLSLFFNECQTVLKTCWACMGRRVLKQI